MSFVDLRKEGKKGLKKDEKLTKGRTEGAPKGRSKRDEDVEKNKYTKGGVAGKRHRKTSSD